MALDRQVDHKNPIDEARLPGPLSLLTATVDAPLLIQDPTGAIPRIGEVSPSSQVSGNGMKPRRIRRLRDKLVCLECGRGFRPEGGSHVICNTCGLKAWGTKRAEEYKTLVSMITGPLLWFDQSQTNDLHGRTER